jgi:hypothetical protein
MSGYFSEKTKMTFRSLSARVFLLVQMSSEMWDFAENGELYFEKAIGFLKVLFQAWQKMQATHRLTLMFFSRTKVVATPEREGDWGLESQPNTSDATLPENVLQCDRHTGQWYQDHYKVVVDADINSTKQWEQLLVRLKMEFHQYEQLLRWGQVDHGLYRCPSPAAEGNMLEAVNLVVSVFEKHYIDRDLGLTGQNIAVITAGKGLFKVDPLLARMTSNRMVDSGIGCDVVSMARPPLHRVPLFWRQPCEERETDEGGDDGAYELPCWLTMSFHDHQDFYERPYGTPLPPGANPMALESTEAFFTNPRGLSLRSTPPGSECVVPKDHAGSISFPGEQQTFFEKHDRAIFPSHKNPAEQLAAEDRMRSLPASVCNTPSLRPQEFNSSSPSLRGLSALEPHSMSLASLDDDVAFNDTMPMQDKQAPATNVPSRWKRPFVSLLGRSPHEMKISSLVSGIKLSSNVSRSLQTSRRLGSNQPPLVIETIAVDERLLKQEPLINSRPNTSNTPAAVGRQLANKKRGQKESKEDRDFNPFQPTTQEHTKLDHVSQDRWGHLKDQQAHTSEETFGLPNWKSLCKPAILPLTTDKFATQHELSGGDYVEYPNTLFLNLPVDTSGGRDNLADNALVEMLCQRLAADYQHVVNPQQQLESELKNTVPRMWGNTKGRDPETRVAAQESNAQKKAQKQTYLFAIHSQYHKIVLDQSTITVTRYVDKTTFTRPNIKLP